MIIMSQNSGSVNGAALVLSSIVLVKENLLKNSQMLFLRYSCSV